VDGATPPAEVTLHKVGLSGGSRGCLARDCGCPATEFSKSAAVSWKPTFACSPGSPPSHQCGGHDRQELLVGAKASAILARFLILWQPLLYSGEETPRFSEPKQRQSDPTGQETRSHTSFALAAREGDFCSERGIQTAMSVSVFHTKRSMPGPTIVGRAYRSVNPGIRVQ
jgi:hypothetical protein